MGCEVGEDDVVRSRSAGGIPVPAQGACSGEQAFHLGLDPLGAGSKMLMRGLPQAGQVDGGRRW